MNGQIFPGTHESLNRQTHETLLREARKARLLSRGRRTVPQAPEDRYSKLNRSYRKPNILEPAVSAILTVAIALQLAVLVAL